MNKHTFLMDIKVKDVLTRQVLIIPSDTDVERVNELMLLRQHEEVLVEDDDHKIIGIITRNDLAKNLARGIDKKTPVTEIMTQDVIFLEPDMRLIDAKYEMRRYGIGRAPVLDKDGKLMGLLTAKDICDGFSAQLQKAEDFIELLTGRIKTAICVLDSNQDIIFYNTAFEELFYPSRIVGFTPEKFLPLELIERIKKGEQPLEDIYFENKGRKFAAKLCPIGHEGKNIPLLLCIEEISSIVNLIAQLEKASQRLQSLEKKLKSDAFDEELKLFQTKNPDMIKAIDIAKEAAMSDNPVLIVGEQGVGKKYLSRFIHENSSRKTFSFVKVDCNMQDELLESELFGHKENREFSAKKGLVEKADKGTLLFEEIAALSPKMQEKILTLIKEGLFYKTGSNIPIKVNVRIIATTSKDVKEMVSQGRFSRELWDALMTRVITIPPLRERKEDILSLMQTFINEFEIRYGKKITHVDTGVVKFFMDNEWVQNISELKNVTERLVILSDQGRITEAMLPNYLKESTLTISGAKERISDLEYAADIAERKVILETLKRYAYNKTKTAKALKISRSTLYNKMKQYGIKM